MPSRNQISFPTRFERRDGRRSRRVRRRGRASRRVPAATRSPRAQLPALGVLAGGPLIAGCARTEPGRVVREVDATLGVDGLPQSGTGQTTLFTGVNAAQALDRHVPAFPGPRLKAIIEAEGLLARVASAGRRVTFANAFTPSLPARSRRRHAARVGDGPRVDLRRRRAPHRGRPATRRGRHLGLPARLLSAGGGRARARDRRGRGRRSPGALAARHDLTLYETFITDLAGHGRIRSPPATWWSGSIASSPACSARSIAEPRRVSAAHARRLQRPRQHRGAGARRHTRNPVPLIALGPARRVVRGRAVDHGSRPGCAPRAGPGERRRSAPGSPANRSLAIGLATPSDAVASGPIL